MSVENSKHLKKKVFPKKDGSAGTIFQVEYIQGSHGAALVEDNWDTITDFIVKGTVDPNIDPSHQAADPTTFRDHRQAFIELVGKIPIIVWILLGLLAFSIGKLILFLGTAWTFPEWLITTILISYLWVLWRILTRL